MGHKIKSLYVHVVFMVCTWVYMYIYNVHGAEVTFT